MDAQDIATLRAELEVLVAKEEIRVALAKFCRGMDRIDDDLAISVWAPGARASYDGIFEGTGEDLCRQSGETHRRRFRAHAHEISNCLIEVAGDRAASETYVTASVLSDTAGKHVVTTVHGRYLDRWIRHEGRWLIEDRRFVRIFSYDQLVGATLGADERSPADASYDLFRAFKTT